MATMNRIVIVCDVCASTLPTRQATNIRKARGEARAAGWLCIRHRGDWCNRCKWNLDPTPFKVATS